jgi:hypothetical protein
VALVGSSWTRWPTKSGARRDEPQLKVEYPDNAQHSTVFKMALLQRITGSLGDLLTAAIRKMVGPGSLPVWAWIFSGCRVGRRRGRRFQC